MAKVFSVEDGNLSKVSIVTSRKREYKDIDLSFNRRTTGDIFKKTEAAAVKQAVRTLLNTNRFEKPFKPDFGADIQGLLFELADDETGGELIERIKNTIETYEPRAAVRSLDVSVSADENSVDILLVYQIRNTDQTVTFETTVSRLR